ncbi:MAG: 1,4-alpha-glucan-branching enzyme, partial [Clostridia bacterium]|nr:1,4-alpha-glucan-branching enzyme [Clostridia bacterium]
MYKIFDYDPYLLPFEKDIILRNERLDALKKRILPPFSNKREEKRALLSFASAYEYYGFHKVKGGYVYREYAPHAKELYLVGDFNDWNRFSHKLIRHFDGSFEIFIPQNIEGSRIKVRVVADNFDELKIPLYANYVVRNEDYSMVGKVYNSRYKFKNKRFVPNKDLFIYETHIGMAQDKEGVGTYDEFRRIVLPKIKESGYTAIQIMGIMEHPYYASFG